MADNKIRLQKFLAENGVASRRKSEELIERGKVRVNGHPASLGDKVDPKKDLVTVSGERIYPAETGNISIMLNKPRGYVSTNADPHAEKKAVDLIRLPDSPRLFSAGRLDKESEGMLLFSNDGDYVAVLTHPRNEILKTYIIRLRRELSPAEINRILSGIEDDGETLRALEMHALGDCRYSIILNEGRKRDIRRMTAAVKEALGYIEVHFAEPLNIEQIARAVGVSRYHLCHVFKEITGKTLAQYWQNVRCAKARKLLKNGASVAEAADRTGFSSAEYFTKVYQKHFSVLPSSDKI